MHTTISYLVILFWSKDIKTLSNIDSQEIYIKESARGACILASMLTIDNLRTGNVFKAAMDSDTGRILWTKPVECFITSEDEKTKNP